MYQNAALCGNGLTLYQTTKIRLVPLKAFADNKTNVNKKLKFGLGRVENIMGNVFLFP